MKIKKAINAILIFMFSLFICYYIHISFFKVNVVLYSSLFDGVVATTISAILLMIMKYFQVFNGFEKFQLIVIWLLLGCLIAIAVPTLIDRSLSFYLLEKIQQRGGGIRQDRFNEVLAEYIKEHRLADVRLTEQKESGTIVIVNGCVKLTERGERLVAFSRFFRLNLLPRQRLLLGSYSDDLIDPFRASGNSPGYECR